MITNRTKKQATLATAALLARKPSITLEAIEGSPLDLLMDASSVVRRQGISIEQVLDDAQQTSMVANMGEGSEHDMVMEETASDVVATLNSSINFARKVLAPAAAKVDSAVREAIQNFAPARYYVDAYHIHDIMFSDGLTSMVARFENSPIDALQRIALPDLTEGDLVTMLATGQGSWDGMVSHWLATKPEGWLREVYGRLFGVNVGTNLIPDHAIAVKSGLDGKYQIQIKVGTEDFLLAGYLLSQALFSNPQSTEATGSEWRSIMSTWTQQLGRAMGVFQRYVARQIAVKLMVLHWPAPNVAWVKNPDDARIVVLGNAYNDWLKDGGSPEMLIGALFAGDNTLPTTATDLNAKKEVYANAYQRYEQILAREVASRSGEVIGNAFATALVLALNEATDDELPLGVERGAIARSLGERLQAIRNWPELDIYRTARELLATGVFHKPTALYWLETIDQLMAANVDLSPQEAAYIAVRDYVTTFVANQIRTAA
jgi:hypothetical protein